MTNPSGENKLKTFVASGHCTGVLCQEPVLSVPKFCTSRSSWLRRQVTWLRAGSSGDAIPEVRPHLKKYEQIEVLNTAFTACHRDFVVQLPVVLNLTTCLKCVIQIRVYNLATVLVSFSCLIGRPHNTRLTYC